MYTVPEVEVEIVINGSCDSVVSVTENVNVGSEHVALLDYAEYE